MQIEIQWCGYNYRRYGRPWGARVTFDGGKPVYEWTGHYDGEALVLDAEPGDVIAFGQKDHRNPRGTVKYFAIVEPGAECDFVGVSPSSTMQQGLRKVTEGEARNHLAQRNERDALLAERNRLTARLAQIEQELSSA